MSAYSNEIKTYIEPLVSGLIEVKKLESQC